MPSPTHEVRIIGGLWRGRKLSFPGKMDLRPTPNRIRETLFNWLGQNLSGQTCLDLFAGSGALGFEAASRGAQQVVMVESDHAVFQKINKNKTLLAAEQVKPVMMKALDFLAANSERFNIIFLDPPYRLNMLPELLTVIPAHLAEHGLVYIENNDTFSHGAEWTPWRSKKAGSVHYQLLEQANNG